jgi:cytidylate kinase
MTKRSTFKYFKTSPEIIRLAVMLYVRFPLSMFPQRFARSCNVCLWHGRDLGSSLAPSATYTY